MLLAAGSIVSGNLPLIFAAYVFITMDTRASTDLSQELLSEARALVTQQKYNDAILDATTSLEYKIRSMLDLEHTESFAAIMTRLSKTTVLGQEINRVVVLRNSISHTPNAVEHNEDEANQVIEWVDKVVSYLNNLGISEMYLK